MCRRAMFLSVIMCLSGCVAGPRAKPVDPKLASAIATNARVEALLEQSKYEEGLAEAEKAVLAIETSLGPIHAQLADALCALASARILSGDTPGARPALERGLAMARQAPGEQQGVLADCVTLAGSVALAGKDLPAAKTLYEEALVLREKHQDPNHSDLAYSLHEMAYLKQLSGDPKGAEAMYKRALDIWTKNHGAEHLRVGTAHFSLGYFYQQTGNPEAAELHLCRSLKIRTKLFGDDNGDVVMVRNLLAQLYWQQGMYAKAAPIFEKLLTAAEKQLGADTTGFADALERAGSVRAYAGDPQGALKLHQRALALRLKHLGPDHLAVASSQYQLANSQLGLGKYSEAFEAYSSARKIYFTGSGEGGANVAWCDYGLGRIAAERADFQQAEGLYTNALKVLDTLVGAQHPEVAGIRSSLAGLYMTAGRLDEARQLFEQVLAIQRKAYGERHPATASTLASLAQTIGFMGDHHAAIDLLNRAYEISKRAYGPQHPELARFMVLGGDLELYNEDPDRAVELYASAVDIYLKVYGQLHPTVAATIHNMAHAFAKAGIYDRALHWYSQAFLVYSKILGGDHPWVAMSRCNWGLIRTFSGVPKEGLEVCNLGLSDLQKSLGGDHYWIGQNLRCRYVGHWALGELNAARKAVKAALDIAALAVDELLETTSERERVQIVATRRVALDDYLSLFDRSEDALGAYEAVIRWKGVVLNSLAAQRSSILSRQEPALRNKFEQLSGIRRRLAGLMFSPSSPKGKDDRRKAIQDLSAEKDALERELLRKSAGFKRSKDWQMAGYRDVCKRLGKAEALVDYFGWERYQAPKPGKPSDGMREARVMAFVVLPGKCEHPIRVDLGDYRTIEQAVRSYRSLVQGRSRLSRLQRQSRRLRQLIWAPLEKHLGNAKRIWLIPDASLNEVPFQALMDDDERYLIEQAELAYLSSAQDLIGLSAKKPRTRGALIAGGIDYGSGDEKAAGGGKLRSAGLFPMLALPQTQVEANKLAGWFRKRFKDEVILLSGGEAREDRIRKEMPGKRFLHFATHGFFASGKTRTTLAGARSADAEELNQARLLAHLNPLILSGLVLANANLAVQGLSDEDGVLTAEEVATLDLRGLELVTLSACDTGLGDIYWGQGVMGLRRAFSLAGAQAMVMSLWKVPDLETRLLMEDFYRQVLRSSKRSKASTMRAAQLSMIARQRKRDGQTDPRTWAAFIVSGR